MELDYTISKKDFVQSQRAHLGNTTVIALQSFGAILIGAIAVNAISTKSFSVGWIFALLWGAFLLVGLPWAGAGPLDFKNRPPPPIHAVITPVEIRLEQPNS